MNKKDTDTDTDKHFMPLLIIIDIKTSTVIKYSQNYGAKPLREEIILISL